MQPFPAEEYEALRHGAGFVVRSDRGRIAAVGADRLTYLHAMLTNDIASLRPGTGCYAAYLTPQGRMIADMVVLELGDLTLVGVEASAGAVVLEKLEQFIFSEDVRLSDLTSDLAEIRVAGPDAARRLADVFTGPGAERSDLTATNVAALAEYQSARGSFQGASAVVAADRELGVPAFNVYVPRERAAAFEQALRAAGVVPAGANAAEVLRIEAGRPRFGIDMDETTIPLEAGIEHRAISFTKGCYPGQEVITRVLHRGHGRIAKQLVGVKGETSVVAVPGDRFLIDEKEVGRVTSAAMSPTLGVPIALGYLQRDFAEAGTAVSILHGAERVPAKVVPLPFVA